MDELVGTLELIKKLKQHIVFSRYVVAKMANAEMLRLYFTVGKDIDEQFKQQKWGTKILDSISAQLQEELPGLRGFSAESLKKMRRFYKEWQHSSIMGSTVTTELQKAEQTIWSTTTTELDKTTEPIHQFLSVSFSHHFEIILKTAHEADRWYYIKQAATQFWSVRHLRTELQNQSHLQADKLPNNFKATLPQTLTNKAMRAFKDQYLLDFVNVEDADEDLDERVLEREIVLNIKKFLMSLGSDFSFMGNQFRLKIAEEEYFIDLLFFHRGLQSIVAFELKTGPFKPEYIGKMNFYLSALDDLVKQPHENASIGIILCKEKNNTKVEYSFRDMSKPLGVATYKTSASLPPALQKALPNAETLKKLME